MVGAWNMPLNTFEKMVLLAIADCANDDGFAYPGYQTLLKKTGMGKEALSKNLKILSESGILKIEHHSSIGEGKKVNTYTISSRLVLGACSHLELIKKIKELRKKYAKSVSSTISSRLELRKVRSSNSISSRLEHETSFNHHNEPPVKDIVEKPKTEVIVKKTIFEVPTVNEVSKQISILGYSVDAEAFHAHYSSNGWMVGKNKMKCWKSALVTWEKRNKTTNNFTFESKERRYANGMTFMEKVNDMSDFFGLTEDA